ncbi:MAG: hypothetical protein RBT41_01555 [Clostridia bacterium]|jgi:hypothetical protein|nr:hypothetical protein [Clostridia bacterium]
MRKKRAVFFECLLALTMCWAIPYFLNKSDPESVLLMTGCLIYICTPVLMPVGLATLKTDSPIQGGVNLILMLLPLIASLSHPWFSLINFHLLTTELRFISDAQPLQKNVGVYSFIFFLAGFTFVHLNRGHLSPWKGAILTSFLLTLVYAASFYFLYLQPVL